MSPQPARKILLNPGPATTSQAVKEAQVVSDICPREQEFGDLLTGIRRDLVRVVHQGDAYEAILFGGSGTAAMEAVMSSVVPHDARVLIVENGAYGSRFREIAEAYNVSAVSYRVPYGDYPDVKAIDTLLQANQVSHLFLIHHETTTGMLNPAAEIARMARQAGVRVVLDAMSSYGGLAIDVEAMGIDYLISSSNKCIQGMAGLGFVICRRDLLAARHNHPRNYYLNLLDQHLYFEKTRQTRFTPPVQVCYALRQALDEYAAETGPGRIQRYAENFETLYQGLTDLGFTFLLPREQESGILVAILEPDDPAYDFEDMHDYLFERGFTIYPGKGAREKTFRLSVLGDLRPDDIRAFLAALGGYLKDRGIKAT